MNASRLLLLLFACLYSSAGASALVGGGDFTSSQDAQRACKNMAGERLPNVPLAYISVYRGTDTGDGNYMINFHAQPPNSQPSSGFCIISKSGRLLRFEFDPSPGGGKPGGGGDWSVDAMRSCKNAVSAQIPNVPLAYIQVNRASMIGGGGYMVNFQAPKFSGFCNVYRNQKVQVWSGGRRLQ